MNIEYLLLADAMNFGPDGKVNILGMGWRQINVDRLPGPVSFTIVASITALPSEAGEYTADFSLVLPDSSEELLSRGQITLAAPPEATLLAMVLGVDLSMKPFFQSGRHTLRMKVAGISADYPFRVNVVSAAPQRESASATAAAPKRRRRATVTAAGRE